MKGGNRFVYLLGSLTLLLVMLLNGCAKQQYPDTPELVAGPILEKSAGDIPNFLNGQTQPVLILFYDDKYRQSRDMSGRISLFADKYGGHIQFIKCRWRPEDDATLFGLRMLPTTVLFKDGVELDRIKGIPKDSDALLNWNNDLDLWFLKTALSVQGDEFSGDYTYRFNNSATLTISGY